MTSILFSTSCYIKTEAYRLSICIENDSNELSVSTTNDMSESTSNDTIDSSHSIRLHFELLTDRKQIFDSNHDDTVPETIILENLLNIQLTGSLANHNIDITKKLDAKVNSDAIEKFEQTKSVDESNSSTLSQRFGRVFSQQTTENNEVILSESTQVELNYVHISESFLWTVNRLKLEMDSQAANKFYLILTRYLSQLKHRPQRLLAFVNSECGKGSGQVVYEKDVLPLFAEANISVNTIYTERANHARDYVKEKSLDDYDGLVCVGGDGMFSELCHGLLLKEAQQAKLDMNDPNITLVRPRLRIGVIPAGSTDAVVFGTTGHNDPITSTLQIIVGKSLLIDLATVHSEQGFVRFLATMLSYGFFGNIIEQSDNWRYFGPLRYSLAGVFQFIRNTSYHTQLTINEAPQERSSETRIDRSHRHSVGNDEKNQKETSSRRNDDKAKSGEFPSSVQIQRDGHYKTINCLNMPCRCDKSKYGMSPSVHLGISTTSFRQEFVMKRTAEGDGSFDLILVKRSWRVNFLRFLHRAAHDGRKIEDLSNVERFRATKVLIRPIVTRRKETGNWACDGELLQVNEVTIRAHHQALNLFASGIRLDQIKLINKEESKQIRFFSGITAFAFTACCFFVFVFLFRSHLFSLFTSVCSF